MYGSNTMPLDPPTPDSLPVNEAWQPLPPDQWREDAAAHLLRRISFSANPAIVRSILKHPIRRVLSRFYGETRPLKTSAACEAFAASLPQAYFELYNTIKDPKERRQRRQQLNRENNKFFREFAMDWYAHARDEANSAQEKFVLFLHDILVIDRRKVRDAPTLIDYQHLLRKGIQTTYPQLCKAVSRHPGMLIYLDLKESTAQKPNENFARELFELFVLGEGNYTETDVKEAARAFTGHRLGKRTIYSFNPRAHDSGLKTIFGQRGRWNGDAVIDLAFQQPAARTFFIRELLKFYLTDGELPHEAYIEALGEQWAAHNFQIRYLIFTLFESRLFFHPAYRGNRVKSPTQFYIGLCQDLNLAIVPFQGRLLQSMRSMGQDFYNPPNVRGWQYGQHWINSTTIRARRQVVDYAFSPLYENYLNGNEKKALADARAANQSNFKISEDRLKPLLAQSNTALTQHLCNFFITERFRDTYQTRVSELIGDTAAKGALNRTRNTLMALLQSPAYNLC